VGLLVVVALAAAMLLTALTVKAASPTLLDNVVLAQRALGSKREPVVEPRAFAEELVKASGGNRDWIALQLTVASHESALSARIAGGGCLVEKRECDGGRAWGLFQGHKNAHNADVWGSPEIAVQVKEAQRALRSAFYTCNPKGKLRPKWVAATLSAYAGQRCDAEWGGLAKRVVTFQRVRARL
jgi:hypothetical protein